MKIIENETIPSNELIALIAEKGHSKENFNKIFNKLKMIKVLQKQLKIYFVKFDCFEIVNASSKGLVNVGFHWKI